MTIDPVARLTQVNQLLRDLEVEQRDLRDQITQRIPQYDFTLGYDEMLDELRLVNEQIDALQGVSDYRIQSGIGVKLHEALRQMKSTLDANNAAGGYVERRDVLTATIRRLLTDVFELTPPTIDERIDEIKGQA